MSPTAGNKLLFQRIFGILAYYRAAKNSFCTLFA